MADLTIGQRIAQERRKQNLSQVGLATILDVSRQAISKWESDAAIPEIDKLVVEWKVMFKKYPFAINLTALASSYFYTFFRNCGWKPIHQYQK